MVGGTSGVFFAHRLVSMATTRPRPPLTIAEVVTMTEEDMRIECLRLQIPASGLDKSAIQRQLLGHIVARATSTPASHTTAPPVYAAGTTDQLRKQEGLWCDWQELT